jgi:elongation factor Ts
VTEISASLVKELRDATGAGMMECKKALVESEGDLDAAKRALREKGLAQAGKRAGRETTEGRVLARVDGSTGTIVGVGCETEPVSNNDEFRSFAEKVLTAVAEGGPEAVASLEDERVGLVAKLGENIAIRDSARFEGQDGDVLVAYVHPPAQKIGVLVQLKGGNAEVARELAMHISFGAPAALTRDEISAEEVEAEKQIYLNSTELEGKPEQAKEKIVEGMLAKRFFAKAPGGVLLDQAWSREPSKSVAQVLSDSGAEVVAFKRISLGD